MLESLVDNWRWLRITCHDQCERNNSRLLSGTQVAKARIRLRCHVSMILLFGGFFRLARISHYSTKFISTRRNYAVILTKRKILSYWNNLDVLYATLPLLKVTESMPIHFNKQATGNEAGFHRPHFLISTKLSTSLRIGLSQSPLHSPRRHALIAAWHV